MARAKAIGVFTRSEKETNYWCWLEITQSKKEEREANEEDYGSLMQTLPILFHNIFEKNEWILLEIVIFDYSFLINHFWLFMIHEYKEANHFHHFLCRRVLFYCYIPEHAVKNKEKVKKNSHKKEKSLCLWVWRQKKDGFF